MKGRMKSRVTTYNECSFSRLAALASVPSKESVLHMMIGILHEDDQGRELP
jgi:hypothetical protein